MPQAAEQLASHPDLAVGAGPAAPVGTTQGGSGGSPTFVQPWRPVRSRSRPVEVLIVDDDPAVLGSLGRALESEGFCVRLARDAAECLLRFSLAEPDIVLLDLNLPGESGWDAFDEISHYDPLVPVVIITAQPGQFLAARDACVGALVEKPIDIPSLVDTMHGLLNEDPGTRLGRLTHHGPATRLVKAEREPRP